MNSRKWWAVPLLIVGALGVATAVYVEMEGGDAVDSRLLVAILANMSMQPLVWLGLGGVILWLSAPGKPVKVVPVPSDSPSDGIEPIPSGSVSAERTESTEMPLAYPVPSLEPVELAVGATSTDSDAASPSKQSDGESPELPNRGFDGIVVVLAIVVLLVLALLATVLFAGSRDSDEAAQAVSTTGTNSSATTIAERPATTTTGATTTTVSVESSVDEQIRDLLILVRRHEANGRHVEAADGGDWFNWTDEYMDLARQYNNLAERWDRTYAETADLTSPGFSELLSHALTRRGDGYRLVLEASTPAAVQRDVDSMLWTDGARAMEEANRLFDQVWSIVPPEWQPDAGVPGSAMDDVIGADLDYPDPIPLDGIVVGDCYRSPPASEVVDSVPRADCVIGSSEIYWIEDLSWDFEGFPGDDHVAGYVEQLCSERASARFSIAWREGMSIGWRAPSSESWNAGDARAFCSFDI